MTNNSRDPEATADAVTSAARDPRKHPRKGDVIRLPGDYRDREIARVDDTVLLYGTDRGREIPMSYCSLTVWPRLAEKAKVVSIAPSALSNAVKPDEKGSG